MSFSGKLRWILAIGADLCYTVIKEAEKGDTAMKKCTNCGTEVTDISNFCNMCGGSSFTEPTAPEPEVEEAVLSESLLEEIIPPEPNDPALPAEEPAEQLPAPEEPEIQEESEAEKEPVPEDSEPEDEPIPEEPEAEEEPIPVSTPVLSSPVLDAVDYYTDAGLMPTPSRKHSKIVIAGVLALVVIIVVTIVLMHPQQRFLRAIRAGNASAAGEIYYDSLADKEKRKAKADARLSQYVSEQLELYLSSELSYEDLLASLDTIRDAGIENDSVTGALDQAEALRHHRETFRSAEDAFAEGNYAAAIGLYAEAARTGTELSAQAEARRDEAAGRYRSEVLETAAAAIGEDQFDRAYAILDEALILLPDDQALKEVRADCVQAQYDYNIDTVLAQARGICDSGDYMGALTHLDGYIADYPEEARLLETRNSCVEAFEEYTFGEVYRLASEENFSQAAEVAALGLSVFDSDRVQQLNKVCLSHIPVNLGDMEIHSNDTVGGVWNEQTLRTDAYLEDRYGGSYSHSLSVGCGSVTYLVNHQYDTITGVVAFPKGLTSNSAKKSATLTIYGDGVLLAEFKNFNSKSMPMALDLDISGYEKITLEWSCKGFNSWRDWGDFATIFDGILTPIPQELVDGVG